MSLILAGLLVVRILPLSAIAAEWTGKVVGITDGDTIHVLHDGKEVKMPTPNPDFKSQR